VDFHRPPGLALAARGLGKPPRMHHDLRQLLRAQDGVVSRRQLLELGSDDNEIERMLRRREWSRLHPGVYVEHTGPPTWPQRAWAAVLYYEPAALADGSALRAHGLRGYDSRDLPIIVNVERTRTPGRRPGVVVRRLTGFEAKSYLNLSPPRERIEHALLGEASRKTREDAGLAVVADACQQGRTTVDRLVEALTERPVLPYRRFLLTVLEDIRSGTYSVLEQRYLTRVERPHGLPVGSRQRRVRQGRTPAYRDVEYLGLATIVELNGRLGHEDALDVWADLDRDLAALVAGELTVRAGWGQVLQPCWLAVAVGQILGQRGWTEVVKPCGSDCVVSPAPGAGDTTQSRSPT